MAFASWTIHHVRNFANFKLDELLDILEHLRDVEFFKLKDVRPRTELEDYAADLYEHPFLRRILIRSYEDEDEDYQARGDQSFHLVSLFTTLYGGEGFAMKNFECYDCQRPLVGEAPCPTCVPRMIPHNRMIYRTPICRCVWRHGDRQEICNTCASYGYCGNEYLNILTEDRGIEPLPVNEVECYKDATPCWYDRSTSGLLCDYCMIHFGPRDRFECLDMNHTTSVHWMPRRCDICDVRCLTKRPAKKCFNCNIHMRLYKDIIIKYGYVDVQRR